MSEKPYTTYIQDHKGKILRDYLAIDRTILANETSFMAYVRTSLTLIAGGATIIKFFGSDAAQILGWLFVVVGAWLCVHGYGRYRQVDTLMHQVKGDYEKRHFRASRRYTQALHWTVNLFRKSE